MEGWQGVEAQVEMTTTAPTAGAVMVVVVAAAAAGEAAAVEVEVMMPPPPPPSPMTQPLPEVVEGDHLAFAEHLAVATARRQRRRAMGGRCAILTAALGPIRFQTAVEDLPPPLAKHLMRVALEMAQG